MPAAALVALFVVVALLTGLAAYEWRSLETPARVEPIELRPAPERGPPRRRPAPDRRAEQSPSTGTAPVAPPPAPAGGGGGDDDADDGDDDDGADDGDD